MQDFYVQTLQKKTKQNTKKRKRKREKNTWGLEEVVLLFTDFVYFEIIFQNHIFLGKNLILWFPCEVVIRKLLANGDYNVNCYTQSKTE